MKLLENTAHQNASLLTEITINACLLQIEQLTVGDDINVDVADIAFIHVLKQEFRDNLVTLNARIATLFDSLPVFVPSCMSFDPDNPPRLTPYEFNLNSMEGERHLTEP